MRKQIHIAISGMTCTNCRDRITRKLKKTPGIIQASVSYEDSSAEIIYDSGRISFQQIADIINQLGYRISSRSSQLTRRIFILASIATLYAFLQSSGVLNFLVPGQLADSRMSYGMLLVIGLTTSVHCVAMCGGINLSQTISDLRSFYPALAYNFGRVMSYTVTGGLLGLAGFLANGAGKFEVSLFLQSVLKVAAGVFMLVMGANMLNIFPALRRLSLRLPKFLSDKIILAGIGRKSPLIVGLLNGLMPCGPLQSMWLVALASSNPLSGALSMMMFAMGTVPLMLGLGTIVSAAGKKFSACVKTSGAVLVTVMGLIMITQGGSLGGMFHEATLNPERVKVNEGIQTVSSVLSSGRYPDITVKAGTPVRWIINAPKGSINGCNYKFMIPEYGIEHTLKTGENIIEFTPDRSGVSYYNCWMGMIQGKITIQE